MGMFLIPTKLCSAGEEQGEVSYWVVTGSSGTLVLRLNDIYLVEGFHLLGLPKQNTTNWVPLNHRIHVLTLQET